MKEEPLFICGIKKFSLECSGCSHSRPNTYQENSSPCIDDHNECPNCIMVRDNEELEFISKEDMSI